MEKERNDLAKRRGVCVSQYSRSIEIQKTRCGTNLGVSSAAKVCLCLMLYCASARFDVISLSNFFLAQKRFIELLRKM